MAAAARPALARAARVLTLEPSAVEDPAGYLDLLGGADPPPTGLAQRLMAGSLVPAVYERWWRPALGRVVTGPRGLSMAQEQRLARRLLAPRPGETVLDVACGPGAFTRRFARDVGDAGTVIGIDVSAAMLTRAVRDPAPPVVYVRADATDLAVRPGSVDAVCCFAALHLFADPWAALDVMAAALRPGGRLAVLTSVLPRHPLGARAASLTARAAGLRLFGAGELARAFAERGLDVFAHHRFGAVQVLGADRRPTRA